MNANDDNRGHGGGNPGPADDNHGGGRDEVTIKIDKKTYKSPAVTTGEALYKLGKVAAGFELYREIKGADEKIENNTTPVKVKNGDDFYSIQSSLNPGA